MKQSTTHALVYRTLQSINTNPNKEELLSLIRSQLRDDNYVINDEKSNSQFRRLAT